MTVTIVAAVLGAALLHAIWNSIAHGINDRLAGFALIGVVDMVVGGALALISGPPPIVAWLYIVASAAAHVIYNVLLLVSYHLGEFSQVYPFARGTSPWVVALASVLLLDRSLPPQQLVGVLAISAGLLGLVFVGGRPGRLQLPAVAAAFVTGLMIALCTVIDGVGLTQTPLLTYIGWIFLLQGPALPLWAVLRRRRQFATQLYSSAVLGFAGGTISVAAYSIVLWAQLSGALAPIAALRETSIVFSALIGALLGEGLGRRRATVSIVILGGVLVLSLA